MAHVQVLYHDTLTLQEYRELHRNWVPVRRARLDSRTLEQRREGRYFDPTYSGGPRPSDDP